MGSAKVSAKMFAFILLCGACARHDGGQYGDPHGPQETDPLSPILKFNPADEAINVNSGSSLTITFRKEMQSNSVTTQPLSGACVGNLVVSADNFATCLGGRVTATSDAKIFVFTPASAFDPDRTHEIHINSGILTEQDEPIGRIFSAAFTTADTIKYFGAGWQRAIPAAAWPARIDHAMLAFNQKLWIMGGQINILDTSNDVWNSSDGITWTNVTTAALWSKRMMHTGIVYKEKMWVFGGNEGGYSNRNDVWNSGDGANWSQVTGAGQWPERNGHSTVVFGEKIWIMGGRGGQFDQVYMNDVWYSSNGANWTAATLSAPWVGRWKASALVYDNKIWIIGGFIKTGNNYSHAKDVWYSSDGANWTRATYSAPWGGRMRHISVVFGEKMWLIGGIPGWLAQTSDAWFSTDGQTWKRSVNSPAPWSARFGHSGVVFDSKIWVTGGLSGNAKTNDVWYTTDPG